jgi:dTMP kinase
VPLIAVEGIDGAGKTTLVEGLAAAMPGAIALREPGGVELSERIRALVTDPALTVSARAEALLYAAARAQLVEERLRPLLDSGATVLLDRFVDSSLAYQGGGRGLGFAWIRAINDFRIVPDRTILLRLDPAVARARRGPATDRLEAAGAEFFDAIARAYDELAAAEPDRYLVLDADRPREEVLQDALRYVDA